MLFSVGKKLLSEWAYHSDPLTIIHNIQSDTIIPEPAILV